MRRDRAAGILAGIAVTCAAGTTLAWMAVGGPARGGGIAASLALPLLWAWVELGQVRGQEAAVERAIMTLHRCCIAWGGLLLTVRRGMQVAVEAGGLDGAWIPAGQRLNGLLLGIGMVLFGNHLPTLRSPWTLRQQPFAWQQVHRFVGWTLVVAGLTIVGCWTVLGVVAAAHATARIIVTASLVCLIRKLASVAFRAAPGGHPG